MFKFDYFSFQIADLSTIILFWIFV